MTIKQARQILGKQAEGVSDNEIQSDIEVAELLKNLFFEMVSKRNKVIKKTGKNLPILP